MVASHPFEIDGVSWFLKAFPKGDNTAEEYLSLYLSPSASFDWSSPRKLTFDLIVVNQRHDGASCAKRAEHTFISSCDWGFRELISLRALHHPEGDFVVADELRLRVRINSIQQQLVPLHVFNATSLATSVAHQPIDLVEPSMASLIEHRRSVSHIESPTLAALRNAVDSLLDDAAAGGSWAGRQLWAFCRRQNGSFRPYHVLDERWPNLAALVAANEVVGRASATIEGALQSQHPEASTGRTLTLYVHTLDPAVEATLPRPPPSSQPLAEDAGETDEHGRILLFFKAFDAAAGTLRFLGSHLALPTATVGSLQPAAREMMRSLAEHAPTLWVGEEVEFTAARYVVEELPLEETLMERELVSGDIVLWDPSPRPDDGVQPILAFYQQLHAQLHPAAQRSAPPAAVTRLPSYTHSAIANQTLSCGICLEAVADGERLKVLPCFHRFHCDCIGPWLTREKHCPICRSSIAELIRAGDHQGGHQGEAE